MGRGFCILRGCRGARRYGGWQSRSIRFGEQSSPPKWPCGGSACALVLLARPALQEIKQEQKELRQEQNITKAILQQVVTDDQLQDQVRFGGSTPTVVLNGRLLLVGFLATFPAWSGPSGHQVLLAASILSQNLFLLPFLQLNELRAMMGTGMQQQGESHVDNKLVRKLLHRCERLQQQVDSLVPQQVQRSLPEKTQVGS